MIHGGYRLGEGPGTIPDQESWKRPSDSTCVRSSRTQDWTADRTRIHHLLRRDVPSVRSVDPLVWVRPPGTPAPPPEAGELWTDLPGLLAAARALDGADAVVVRITALEEDGDRNKALIRPGRPLSGMTCLATTSPTTTCWAA